MLFDLNGNPITDILHRRGVGSAGLRGVAKTGKGF